MEANSGIQHFRHVWDETPRAGEVWGKGSSMQEARVESAVTLPCVRSEARRKLQNVLRKHKVRRRERIFNEHDGDVGADQCGSQILDAAPPPPAPAALVADLVPIRVLARRDLRAHARGKGGEGGEGHMVSRRACTRKLDRGL